MNINRPFNTKERGRIEYLTYKDEDKYVGVCLTFDIVEEGDDPIALMKSVEEASLLHLEAVIKENLSDNLLNRYAPEEYWDKYFSALERARQERLKQENEANGFSSFFRSSPYQQTQAVAIA